jgi:hypothetical protein
MKKAFFSQYAHAVKELAEQNQSEQYLKVTI